MNPQTQEYKELLEAFSKAQEQVKEVVTDLCFERQARQKSDNEVARLREELIQANQKAKEWKEKYRKLDLSVRCEYCDPNGTIWECCTKRQYEQAAEIERLKAELARFATAPEEPTK